MDVPPLTPEMRETFPSAAVAFIEQLLAIIRTLQTKVAELEAKLGQNSLNSSKPPSSDGPAVKRSPPQAPSGNKRGGQPGHPRQTRDLIPSDQCDHLADCLPAACRNCDRPLTGTDPNPLRYQVTELPPVKPVVTEYRRHRLVCSCGVSTCGELPDEVAGQDGPRLRACVTLLTGQYRLSKEMAAHLLNDLFGVSISAGQVCAVEAEAGEIIQPVADELLAAARQAPANIDETSMGKGRWLWAMVTTVGTVFQIVPGRKREELVKLIGPDHAQITASDRHSLYGHLPASHHQFCWAHLRRDFQSMIDRKSAGSEAGRELLALSDELFGYWHRVRDKTMTKPDFARKMRADAGFRTRFKAALQRGAESGCAKTGGTCRQLADREASLYRFAFCADVEPTNNAAERSIRHGVIWRRQSHGPKSESGAKYLANIWSVVETCRQHGGHVWGFLTQCLTAAHDGRPLPSLVPPKTQTQAA